MITSECPTIRESDPGPIGLGGELVIMHSLRRFIGLRKHAFTCLWPANRRGHARDISHHLTSSHASTR
jgi:hypothetical protein